MKSQAAAHDITAYPTPHSEKQFEPSRSPADIYLGPAYLQSSKTKMEPFEEHSTLQAREEVCFDSIAQPACHTLLTEIGGFQ